MSKKSFISLLCLAALLLAGSAALCWRRSSERPPSDLQAPRSSLPAPSIVTTSLDSHRPMETYSETGDIRPRPADPALAEALSLTSRLAYPLRLKAVHALYGATISPEQAAVLRAFVADPTPPEGLTIHQVRALKNDVLNVLCVQPGGEAATAAMLRALHADETADPGLRDYALQHLVRLIERDPSIGWETHWTAIEGDNPALAATALLHFAIRHRQGELTADEFSRVQTAALRLAADPSAKEPARTTALQVCGRLRLAAARPLAAELARDSRVGFPLRIAAVATLGDLGGDAETRDYLTSLTTGPEKRLRVPARSALQRFSIN